MRALCICAVACAGLLMGCGGSKEEHGTTAAARTSTSGAAATRSGSSDLDQVAARYRRIGFNVQRNAKPVPPATDHLRVGQIEVWSFADDATATAANRRLHDPKQTPQATTAAWRVGKHVYAFQRPAKALNPDERRIFERLIGTAEGRAVKLAAN